MVKTTYFYTVINKNTIDTHLNSFTYVYTYKQRD